MTDEEAQAIKMRWNWNLVDALPDASQAKADIRALLDERAALLEIVRAVVDDPPEYEDNGGAGCCYFCGDMTRYNEHQPDCLLLKARAALGIDAH